jgi:AcrR family transcriptional regulator
MSLMTTPGLRPGEQRPGGRTAKVRTAVLQATLAALAEEGYEALNVETVARRAGVHKTTVYRRWPTKAELVANAMRARSNERVEVPDTGTLAGDLQVLARAIAANIGSDDGSSLIKNLLAVTGTSNVLADETREFWAERLRLTGEIVHRAVARGELPVGIDTNLVIEALIGPLYVRLLFTGEPIDNKVADQVARMVASGAGGLDRP